MDNLRPGRFWTCDFAFWIKGSNLESKRQNRKSERGYSLLEFLLVAVIFVLLSGSVFSLIVNGQRQFTAEEDFKEAVQNARMAMEVVARMVREIGNNPSRIPCDDPNVPRLTEISSSRIRFISDLTSTSGQGDPDGRIDGPLENVTIEFDDVNDSITIRSGSGSAQPMAKDILALRFEGFDRNGNATTDPACVVKLRITILAAAPERNLQESGREAFAVSSEVSLRYKEFNPFSSLNRSGATNYCDCAN